MTLVPTLETERLTLRGFRDSDLDGYAALMGDQRAYFVGGPLSREDAWRKMSSLAGHWLLRGYGTFAIETKSDGKFAGYCGPWFPFGFPEPDIGWALLPEATGKGFATEAARAALTYAFETLRWRTAISLIAPANTASLRVAERLGAVRDGETDIRGLNCWIFRHRAPDNTAVKSSGGGA